VYEYDEFFLISLFRGEVWAFVLGDAAEYGKGSGFDLGDDG